MPAERQGPPKQCPRCPKTFTRTSSLKRHIEQQHTGHLPTFHCTQCDKSFSRADILERHLRAHRGEGTSECMSCGRSFRKDYLDQHQGRCSFRLGEYAATTIDLPSVPWANKPLKWMSPKGTTIPENRSMADVSSKKVRFVNCTGLRQHRAVEPGQKAPAKARPSSWIDLPGPEQQAHILTSEGEIENLHLEVLSDTDVEGCQQDASVSADDISDEIDLDDLTNRSIYDSSPKVLRAVRRYSHAFRFRHHSGATALHYAAWHGHVELARRLLRPPGRAIVDPRGEASSSGDCTANSPGTLIPSDCVDCRDYLEKTPLLYASRARCIDMVAFLLSHGADVNAHDRFGRTALFHAHDRIFQDQVEKEEEAEIVDMLLKAGADVNVVDDRGRTALMHAIQFGGAGTVAKLIRPGADVRRLDRLRMSAQCHAWEERVYDEEDTAQKIRILIEAGGFIEGEEPTTSELKEWAQERNEQWLLELIDRDRL